MTKEYEIMQFKKKKKRRKSGLTLAVTIFHSLKSYPYMMKDCSNNNETCHYLNS